MPLTDSELSSLARAAASSKTMVSVGHNDLAELVRAARAEKKLEALIREILQHYDPMFAYINLRRLDDRVWMDKAREALGEDKWIEIFSWWKRP